MNMCAAPNSEVQVKTERDIEQTLGIKTEPMYPEENVSSAKMSAPSTSNEITWPDEKKKLVVKMVELKKENQRITLNLRTKIDEFESLTKEKQNVEQKVAALTADISTLKSELTQMKSDFTAQNILHRQTIANLTSENKTLQAQVHQLQAGIDLNTTFNSSISKIESESSKSNDIFEVESLVAHKKKRDGLYYLVRWKNFTPEYDTWERESNLMCSEILKTYKRKMKL